MRIKDITKESQQLDENIFKLGLDAFKRGTKFLKGKTKPKSLDAKTARAVNRASKSLIKDLETRTKELNFRYQNQRYADRHKLVKDLQKVINEFKPQADRLGAIQMQFYKMSGVPDLEIDSLIKAYKDVNRALKTGTLDQKYLKQVMKQLDEYPQIMDIDFVFANMYSKAMIDAKYNPELVAQLAVGAVSLLVFISALISFLVASSEEISSAISKIQDKVRPEETEAQD